MVAELAEADQRVRPFRPAANLGLPRARNVLLCQARCRHAMLLDADNRLVPQGVATLYAAARDTGATMTYGPVAIVGASGEALGLVSCERPGPALAEMNRVDAMVLVRTERLLALGGYEPDLVYGVEDWELNLRLLRHGEPVACVPTLVGVYRSSALSMVNDAELPLRTRRLQRMFTSDGPPDPNRFRAAVYHPNAGRLWQSPGWGPMKTSSKRAMDQDDWRVLVVSSGGVRNHGDDAILLSTLQRLQRVRPGCLPVVVTDEDSIPELGRLGIWAGTTREFCRGLDPNAIRAGCGRHTGAAAELPARVDAGTCTPIGPYPLDAFDAVLLSGGGNLTTHWPHLVYRRAAIAAAARALDVRCIVSGQGIGPLSAEMAPLLSVLVDAAAHFGVRDPKSAELLRELSLLAPHVTVVGDDALGLRTEPEEVRARLAELGVPLDQPVVGFHVRHADGYVGIGSEELQAIARSADELAIQMGGVVLGLPINSQSPVPEFPLLLDLARGRRVPWFVLDAAEDVAALAAATGLCRAVLTCSFHVALFALERHVPTVLFSRTPYYERKGKGLQGTFTLPCAITLSPDCGVAAIRERLAVQESHPWQPAPCSDDVDRWLASALPAEQRLNRRAA